jgi:hypothetical protein
MHLHEGQWKNGIYIMEFHNMDAFLRNQPFCNAGICWSMQQGRVLNAWNYWNVMKNILIQIK